MFKVSDFIPRWATPLDEDQVSLPKVMEIIINMPISQPLYIPDRAPSHPGQIMQRLLPRLGLTEEVVASKLGENGSEKLQAIFNGQASVDIELREQLRDVLHSAADVLYNHQKTYDFYAAHGHWPIPQ